MYAAVLVSLMLALPAPAGRPHPSNGAGPHAGGYDVWANQSGHTGKSHVPGDGEAHKGSGSVGGSGGSCGIGPGVGPSTNSCGSNGAPFGVQLPSDPEQPGGQPTVTPAQLAAFAYRQLALPPPTVRTAPPRGFEGLVGVPHFFWVDRARWVPISRRAEAGAVWAVVTARPDHLTIRPGDGATLVCDGPGAPYDKGRRLHDQDTDCTHLYERPSAGQPRDAYRATASVIWTADWTSSGGTGGTLPSQTVSTTYPIPIAETQALIQKAG